MIRLAQSFGNVPFDKPCMVRDAIVQTWPENLQDRFRQLVDKPPKTLRKIDAVSVKIYYQDCEQWKDTDNGTTYQLGHAYHTFRPLTTMNRGGYKRMFHAIKTLPPTTTTVQEKHPRVVKRPRIEIRETSRTTDPNNVALTWIPHGHHDYVPITPHTSGWVALSSSLETGPNGQ